MMTPRGVAKENITISLRHRLKSLGKVFTREMPKEDEAAPLWMTIASSMLITEAKSAYRPRARPSKMEWTESAIIKMKGVMLGQQLVFFFKSAIEVLISCSWSPAWEPLTSADLLTGGTPRRFSARKVSVRLSS